MDDDSIDRTKAIEEERDLYHEQRDNLARDRDKLKAELADAREEIEELSRGLFDILNSKDINSNFSQFELSQLDSPPMHFARSIVKAALVGKGKGDDLQ